MDILQQVQTEQYPGEILTGSKVVSAGWSCKDWTNYFVSLYIKYVDILKRVEDCYDQTTHPQMRKMLMRFLKNLLCRVVQVKKELIFYNNPIIELPGIVYVFLDDYLIDLKLEPEALDLPLPRFFREDNSEKAQTKRFLIDERLKDKWGNTLPEEDVTKFFFKVELQVDEAVKILQNFEMGRQNLKRINKAIKLAHKKAETDLNTADKKIMMEDERKKIVMEHLIAVQKLKKTREDEAKFLKMMPEEKIEDIGIKLAEENRVHRKVIQREKESDYDKYKNDLTKNIKTVEGYEIRQGMINERKEWMDKEKEVNKGEPPYSIKLFYDKLNVEKKVELDENQKKVNENIAKDKLKKEQDKKKKEENGNLIKCIFNKYLFFSAFVFWPNRTSKANNR